VLQKFGLQGSATFGAQKFIRHDFKERRLNKD
jgi:hypothetical protein